MTYERYESPYTWRYSSDELRVIWSEAHKRRLWRRIWVALAEVQQTFGLVSNAQAADLRAHADQVDMERALQIEAEIHHDVMAEIRTFAEQCEVGGAVIHLGMTSMDVVDNADALRMRDSLDILVPRIRELLLIFCDLMENYAEIPLMAFTHLQPAEPSTMGYRVAQYAQDLWRDLQNLVRLRADIRGKGLKGAVGTSASFAELIGTDGLPQFEQAVSERLDLPFFEVATQVYPRKQDYEVLSALAGLGATLYKFAFDVRLLQSPPIGELAEPFGSKQVGSSAMPFKRNPIHAEKVDSLARLLAQLPRVAWDNAAHTLLERTLDDSANRRTTLPEAFLIADELLLTTLRIAGGLRLDEQAMARNLAVYGPFAATERLLMALVAAGADRQEMHERIRTHAMAAWATVQAVQVNPLIERVSADPVFRHYLEPNKIIELMDASGHIGDAPIRSRRLAGQIRAAVNEETP